MRYCPTCTKAVEEEVCPTCGTPTEVKGSGSKKPAVRRILTPAEGGAAEVVPFKVAPNPTPEPERREEPPTQKPWEPAEPTRPRESGAGRVGLAARARRLEGETELEAFLAHGYEIFLVAGIEGVGKTELLSSFRQDGFLEGFQKKSGMVIPTAPGTLNCHPIRFGRRRILFVDASGENFRLLYPDVHTGAEVTEADVSFLMLVARGLRGLVLLVELERLWDERAHATRPADAQQVQILAWTLSLLRWLTFDGRYNRENNPIKFSKQVDASIKTMRKRLKVPVQVLYSKADQLADYPIPQALQGADWIRQGSGSGPTRRLYPIGEDPLLFTYHCLKELYNAVDVHANHYRFDFAHSLVTRKGPGTVADSDPCGVSLALQWLLDPSWSSRWPMISTRRWVTFQRSFDQALGRSRRWARLLDPKEIRA